MAALVGLRTATIGLDVHFLGAEEGRITCSAEVVHRTRRIATVEARVRDGNGNLVAMGTGTFRIFEKRGDPIGLTTRFGMPDRCMAGSAYQLPVWNVRIRCNRPHTNRPRDVVWPVSFRVRYGNATRR